ncbi:hypothetical protein [Blastococcus xanthinilyticus]|uniref:Uncharacterized protein n=1 Tax=Blastococcus xanthinilyticus TaxID=1564164 RepID=A0A5S5CLL9_9ACTN|nr:hypothetical protein [Blastococcus xanthinilyticus]TYP82087.1 hypothetical protein BD833_12071 [Blastococcus xanthinilyticus]
MPVLRHSTAVRNAIADTVVGMLDAGTGPGKIEIRSGGMPAGPNSAATGTLLATVALPDPASTSASNGVDTIIDPVAVTGVADGTATWARFLDSANVAVMDCDVSATGGTGAITLVTTTISAGVEVDLNAITYSVPA